MKTLLAQLVIFSFATLPTLGQNWNQISLPTESKHTSDIFNITRPGLSLRGWDNTRNAGTTSYYNSFWQSTYGVKQVLENAFSVPESQQTDLFEDIVDKLEIRPDTAAVGDTVFIKVSIKDSLVTGTKYYWSSAAFPFLDGNLSGANYITEMGENRVYLSPSDIPDSAFSTDSTVLSWRGSIYISNPPLPGGGLQQLFYIKIKKD